MPGVRDLPSIVFSILACISHHAEKSVLDFWPSRCWRRRRRQKSNHSHVE